MAHNFLSISGLQYSTLKLVDAYCWGMTTVLYCRFTPPKMAATFTLPSGIEDPYLELGLVFGASDSEISKSFRALARIYHPDKQVNSTPEKQLLAETKFLRIKSCIDFLSNKPQKELYDATVQAKILAAKKKEQREGAMDERRRAMKRRLEEGENVAKMVSPVSSGYTSQQGPSSKGIYAPEDKIRRDNIELRERLSAKCKTNTDFDIALRTVNIKWKRKIHSFSEDSITKMMSTFGEIESCVFVGPKGNSAKVMFLSADCAERCAAAFNDDQSMLVTVAGGGLQRHRDAPSPSKNSGSMLPNSRDYESISDFNKRKAAAREGMAQGSATSHVRKQELSCAELDSKEQFVFSFLLAEAN